MAGMLVTVVMVLKAAVMLGVALGVVALVMVRW